MAARRRACRNANKPLVRTLVFLGLSAWGLACRSCTLVRSYSILTSCSRSSSRSHSCSSPLDKVLLSLAPAQMQHSPLAKQKVLKDSELCLTAKHKRREPTDWRWEPRDSGIGGLRLSWQINLVMQRQWLLFLASHSKIYLDHITF